MCLLVNQIFDVLFDYIKWCEFFPILYKTMQKIPNTGGRVRFPKWVETRKNESCFRTSSDQVPGFFTKNRVIDFAGCQ